MRIRPILIVLFMLGAGVARTAAQDPQTDLGQAFRDLRGEAVVMDLSAHPDDEDGASLAFYRMKAGVTTYSVLFTRGEGGQNEKGPELYEELGVIRSHETRAAGAILGTHVVFLNFKDFGFSKTATEAIRIWGGQMETLRRLTYVIRKYKPDILFTNHNTIDGHGQHQAVAVTAIAAFDAAADPSMFPEQLREPGLSLWQPRKLFFRVFGRAEGTGDVSNAINDIDSLRGVSYLDIAARALRQHRTQGMDRANLRSFTRGRSLYKLMRTSSLYEQDSTSFLAGIDFNRDASVSSLQPLRALVWAVHPGIDRDSLLSIVARAGQTADSITACCRLSPLAVRIMDRWRDALDRVAMISCGIRISAALADTIVVPGERVDCTVAVSSEGCSVTGARWRFSTPPGWSAAERSDAAPQASGNSRIFTLRVGGDALPTVPEVEMQYHSLERRQDVNAVVSCRVNGRPVTLSVPVRFDVAPLQTITVSPQESGFIRDRMRGPLTIRYRIRNWQPRPVSGTVSLEGPAGWSRPSKRFTIPREDSTASGTFEVAPPPGVRTGEYRFRVKTASCEASLTIRVFDAAVAPGVRLGIVESYDNTLEAAARELAVPYTMLDDSALAHGDLSRYSTIVIDIRAYLVRGALQSHNHRLLEFARQGGTLLVMYQRDQEWKPEYAPYPFRISRMRVTEEDAPVTILLPGHPLMTTPNRIGPEDWQGWKQERGLYFPADVPPAYDRLLACSDPDEEPLTTGLITARTGKGAYIYTSYVWYRQMKEENPGAFRCFANMISYFPGRK